MVHLWDLAEVRRRSIFRKGDGLSRIKEHFDQKKILERNLTVISNLLARVAVLCCFCCTLWLLDSEAEKISALPSHGVARSRVPSTLCGSLERAQETGQALRDPRHCLALVALLWWWESCLLPRKTSALWGHCPTATAFGGKPFIHSICSFP